MARRWEQQSEIGRFLDPIADKLLVSATLFMLTAFGRLSPEALLPALVILCREILVSCLREYLAGLRVGMPVSRLAKWTTLIQMIATAVLMVGDSGPAPLAGAAVGGRRADRRRCGTRPPAGSGDRRGAAVDCRAPHLGDWI